MVGHLKCDVVDAVQKPRPPIYSRIAADYYKPPDQFDEVWQALQKEGARVLVHGAPGLGKSAMANVLAKRFSEVRLHMVLTHVHATTFAG
jgi:MoxR-like ATPase